MRTPFVALLLGLFATALPTRVSAQDASDIAGYVALTFTPAGAFAPFPPPLADPRRGAFVFRYGHMDFGTSSLNNFAIGGDLNAGPGRLGLTVGGTTCDGCDGNVLGGVDYTVPLARNVVSIALRPAFGFSKPTEGDGSAISLAVSLPIGLELSGATGPIFVPYIVPGFGFGRVSGDDDSEGGTRAMLGGGVSIAGRQSNFAVHLGVHRVFLDEGDTVLGLGFSIGGSGARTP